MATTTSTFYFTDQDSYVNIDAGSTEYPNESTLYVGSTSNIKSDPFTYRAFLKPLISGIPSNATVTSATVYLYVASNGGSAYAYAYRCTANWAENTVNWNNQPGADISIASANTYAASNWSAYNFTTAAQNWVSGAWPNYGFRLHGYEGQDTLGTHVLQYNSSENGSNKPYLSVTWTTPPTTPTVTYPNGGETLSGTHNVTWTGSTDSHGSSMTYYVQYSSNNGANWSAVGSTTSLSLSVNFANLAATTQGKIRVRAYNGNVYGSFDESNGTFTNNATPTAPTLVSPSNGAALPNTSPVTFDWTPNDTNAGDTQSAYALRRKRLP